MSAPHLGSGAPTLAYQVVDVFTDAAFSGNPLAVVLDTDDLPTEALQALANEFNLSETAFPQRTATDGADYRLRIFTPTVELPFAGHPSVGAAWVMASLGRVAPGPVVQECGAGLLPLTVDADGALLSGGEPEAGPALDPAPLLTALGLGPDDVAGTARVAGAGLPWTLLHVQDDAVARARAGDLSDVPASGLAVFSLSGSEVHARCFAAGVGLAEDPATGSATLAIGVHLAAEGMLHGAYTVRQGAELGRPSLLHGQVDGVGRTSVRGRVVPVARGEIVRPTT